MSFPARTQTFSTILFLVAPHFLFAALPERSVSPSQQFIVYGADAAMAGQNDRAFPVIIQYVDDKSYVVWPKSQAQREAVLPLPAGSTYSNK